MTLISGIDIGSPALGQGAGAGRELGRYGSVGSHPVCESIFAVLNDSFTSFVSVVGRASLTWSDRRVVNELEKVLSIPGNDGDLFAMLTEGVELVCVSCLDLFSSNVGQLGFGDEGFGFSANQFLL